jgi:hypothetical protein
MDLSKLCSYGVITDETLNWIQPYWNEELAQVEELREAKANNCGGGSGDPLFGSQSDEDDDDSQQQQQDNGLFVSRKSISSLEGVSLSFYMDDFSTGHGNHVWHASIAMCIYVRRWLKESYQRLDTFRCIEFGAGTALPSLFLAHSLFSLQSKEPLSSKNKRKGRPFVHITDARQYRNIRQILLSLSIQPKAILEEIFFRVSPHNWGEGLGGVTDQKNTEKESSDFLQQEGRCQSMSKEDVETYDLIIVSDCIYNPTYHRELLKSISATLRLPICMEEEEGIEDGGCAIVSFSLHGNTPDKDIWDFIEKVIPEQRHITDTTWRLQARPIPKDDSTDERTTQALEEGRFGWNMEETMKNLDLWTANMDPKRWYAYLYEIKWVLVE